MKTLHFRHEIKFVCHENNLCVMEDRIKHFCHPDPYAGLDGTYTVRSLYFDTYSDNCFQEALDGVDNRKKYRIRTYNNNANMIKLECKYSIHGMKSKECCQITRQQCECLIRGITIKETGECPELLRRFLWERSAKLLAPKVIVEYIRTPYVYTTGDVRITFDRAIGFSSEITRFLEKRFPRRGILPIGEQLLEIKYSDILPNPVVELLAIGQQLSRTSFSKYVLCRKCAMR